jgi:hypothetical protein
MDNFGAVGEPLDTTPGARVIAARLASVLIRMVKLARPLRLAVLVFAGVLCTQAASAQVYQGRELVKAELIADTNAISMRVCW